MFKIIFENESDKNTFWGISIDTIFTVLTTLLIFILGYIITKKIERGKERKRLKELEEYFIKSIELLLTPIEKQKKSFLSFANILKEEKEQHFIIEDVADLRFEQIKNIDNKDLFSIFIKKISDKRNFKAELFSKLMTSLNYIETVKSNLKSDINDFFKRNESYKNNYKKNIKKINSILDEIINQKRKEDASPKNYPFLLKINNIRTNWINSPRNQPYTDLYNSFKYFIAPVQEEIRLNQTDEIISLLNDPIMECVYEFHNIKELNTFYRHHFVQQARELQKCQQTITTFLKEVEIVG